MTDHESRSSEDQNPIESSPNSEKPKVIGVVKDRSGLVIPNAKVVISSDLQELNDIAYQTDAAGQFESQGLLPGDYKVRVFAPGLEGECDVKVTSHEVFRVLTMHNKKEE